MRSRISRLLAAAIVVMGTSFALRNAIVAAASVAVDQPVRLIVSNRLPMPVYVIGLERPNCGRFLASMAFPAKVNPYASLCIEVYPTSCDLPQKLTVYNSFTSPLVVPVAVEQAVRESASGAPDARSGPVVPLEPIPLEKE